MNVKKIKRREEKVLLNLEYLRLRADLYALGALIRETEPIEKESKGKNVIFDIIEKFGNRIRNKVGQIAREELLEKEGLAKQALEDFEKSHDKKALSLSNDIEKFKNYISRKLFKKDEFSLKRLQFGLCYAIANNHSYQCYEDSLRAVSEILFESPNRLVELKDSFVENYKKIDGVGVFDFNNNEEFNWETFSREIKATFKSAVFDLLHLGNVKAQEGNAKLIERMSQDQFKSEMAIFLTVLAESKQLVGEEAFKVKVKDAIEKISALRTRAEKASIVDGKDSQENREKIRICNACISRISEISIS